MWHVWLYIYIWRNDAPPFFMPNPCEDSVSRDEQDIIHNMHPHQSAPHVAWTNPFVVIVCRRLTVPTCTSLRLGRKRTVKSHEIQLGPWFLVGNQTKVCNRVCDAMIELDVALLVWNRMVTEVSEGLIRHKQKDHVVALVCGVHPIKTCIATLKPTGHL